MGGLNSGDKLARGAIRATYSSTEKKVSDEKWNDIFNDFDPKKFAAEPNKSMQRNESETTEVVDEPITK